MTLNLSQHVGQNVLLTCRGGVRIQGTVKRDPKCHESYRWQYCLNAGSNYLAWDEHGRFDSTLDPMDITSIEVIGTPETPKVYLPDHEGLQSVVTLRNGLVVRARPYLATVANILGASWRLRSLKGAVYQWNDYGRVEDVGTSHEDIVAIELAGATTSQPTPSPSLEDTLKQHHGRLVVLTLRGGVLMVGTLDATGRGTYAVELLVRGHDTGRLLWTATGGWKAFSTSPDPQDIVAVQAVTALGNEPFDHVVDRLLLHSADAP